jgi:hypothetical protein
MNTTSIKNQAIFGRIFAQTGWQEAMAGLGFTTLLIGSDLERFSDDGTVLDGDASSGAPAYVALGLAVEKDVVPLASYLKGFPHKELFFQCLRPWKWSNEDRHDVLIEGSNLELNVGEYYKRAGNLTLACAADISRLAKERPSASETEDITEKHTTLAISDCGESPTRIVLFYYKEPENNQLLVMIELWGRDRLFQFFRGSGSGTQ